MNVQLNCEVKQQLEAFQYKGIMRKRLKTINMEKQTASSEAQYLTFKTNSVVSKVVSPEKSIFSPPRKCETGLNLDYFTTSDRPPFKPRSNT